MTQHYDVRSTDLTSKGVDRIRWARQSMPVLDLIRKKFESEKPLKGIRIAACLHVTTETANLAITLRDGGAEIRVCASNPLSTQDDVAAALAVEYGIPTFAIKGEDNETYYRHILAALETEPQVTMDDGADLVTAIFTKKKELIPTVIGGTEETTTGVTRLRSMADSGMLAYPIIAVNDANTKHLFDNRYGTGQSTLDGIIRATNHLIAGSCIVISGYGWCGRGIAMRSKGMGADVVITEVDPLKALEAVMDGYRVMPMLDAARVGDIFITVTGDKSVIRKEHFEVMKDGAIVCNSGHFNVEIDIPALESLSCQHRQVREFVMEYVLPEEGKRINLLGEGRLINLTSAEGHPPAVMDMSFANQALSVEHLVGQHETMEKRVYLVPESIDAEVARLKLEALGVHIDTLSEEQEHYLNSWMEGT